MSAYDSRQCPHCFESGCFFAEPSTGDVACIYCGYIDESATHQHLSVDYNSRGFAISDPQDLAGPSGSDHDRGEQTFRHSVRSFIKDWLEAIARIKNIESDVSTFIEPTMEWYLKIRHAELLDLQTRRTKALERRRKKAAEKEEGEPGPSRVVKFARDFHAAKIPYHVAIAIRLALQESHLIVIYARIERALGEAEADRARPEGLGHWAQGGGKVPVLSLQELFDSAQQLPEGQAMRLTSLPFLRASYRRFAKLLGSHMSSQDAVLCNVMDHIEWIRSVLLMPFDERIALFKSTDTLPNGLPKHNPHKWVEKDFTYYEGLPWDDVLPLAYKLWRASTCVNLWSGVSHRGGAVYNYSIALVCWCIAAIRRTNMPGRKGMPPIAGELAALFDATNYTTISKFNEMQKFLICWASSIPDLVDGDGQPIPWPAMEVASTSRSQENEAGDGYSGWKSDSRRKIPELNIAASIASTIADHWQQIATIRTKRRAVVPYEEELDIVRKLVAQNAIAAKPKRPKRPRGWKKKAKEAEERASLDRSSVDTATSTEVSTPVTEPSPGPSSAPSPASTAASIVLDKAGSSRQLSPQPESESWRFEPPSPPRHHLPLYSAPHLTAPAATTRNFWQPPIQPTVEELLRNPEESSDEDPPESDDDDASVSAKIPRAIRREASSVGAGFSLGPAGLRKLDLERPSTPSASEGLRPNGSPVGMRFKPTPKRSQPTPLSVPMSRSGSSSSSHSSNAGMSDITTYSATTLHSLDSAYPNSTLPSRSTTASPETAIRPASDYVPKCPFAGCLARERPQYLVKRIPKAVAAFNKAQSHLHKLMGEWVKEQKTAGSIPHRITPAYLSEIGLSPSPSVRELCLWASSMPADRGWAEYEAWLRAGREPSEIPAFHMPTSVTSFKADLYRVANQLQPIGCPLNGEELDEELKLLFDDKGDDSMEAHILTEEEAKHREWIYAQTGLLDQLTEASAKATERVIQDEEEAARKLQLQATESETPGRGNGKGKGKGAQKKRKRQVADLAGRSMLEGWDEPFIADMDDDGEGGGGRSLAWYTGGTLESLMEMSGEAESTSKKKRRKHAKAPRHDTPDVDMDIGTEGLVAFADEKEDEEYELYWGDEKTDEVEVQKEKKETKKSKRSASASAKKTDLET